MAPAPKFSVEEQQVKIVNAAIECILTSSVTSFTMANVASKAELSMGSVYKHFQCKEDIVMALAHQSFSHISTVFQRVFDLALTTPEKVIAICLLSPEKMQCFPFANELESFATNDAVIQKASAQWTQKMIDAGARCEQTFKARLSDGITADEFKDAVNVEEFIEEITVSGWAMNVGYEQVLRVQQSRQIVEGTASIMAPLSPSDPLIRSMIRLINSYPWRHPLTQDAVTRVVNLLTELHFR
ncbi:TetR/AcrR family transcriptional regulator [Alteromonas sp. 009811495]|uniref:TetR/AcrR family transcriptional regulator n=1 Tax=Alteromonas sp. 009811495 TaxID=3002962 RepID=UPI00237D7D54|nr:TetR/AcrR family transcriptional regulator [Alteromonas sp. 009811495]WDT87557.1 TetR/AcrR family transcriptional regulator [Alteromonas sp. 009811495]